MLSNIFYMKAFTKYPEPLSQLVYVLQFLFKYLKFIKLTRKKYYLKSSIVDFIELTIQLNIKVI